jgi:hypothetical protein
MIVRISKSKPRNGMNSSHADSHNFTTAGYLASQTPANSTKRSNAAASVGAL